MHDEVNGKGVESQFQASEKKKIAKKKKKIALNRTKVNLYRLLIQAQYIKRSKKIKSISRTK